MSDEQKNIVVVDDEKYICNIIKEALSEFEFYRVHSFDNPKKALTYIAEESVDLVLTDLVMGEFSGVQILEQTLAFHADAIVVLMTGYPTVKTAISVLKMGGYDYLVKPFKLEDLKATIRRGLDNQQTRRENVELRGQLELMKLSEEISRGIRTRSVLKMVVNAATRVLPNSSASILLKAENTGNFEPKCIIATDKCEAVDLFLRGEDNLRPRNYECEQYWSFNEEFEKDGEKQKRSYLSYPLISRGNVVGLLNLVYTHRYSFISKGQQRLVSLLVSSAALAVEQNHLNHNLRNSYIQTIQTLANAIEARDRYTAGHTDRVFRLARVIARKMGWNEQQMADLRTGCILHDIGKIGVPDAVLNKPGKLNEYERNIMRKHPEVGAKILNGIPFLEPVLPYVLSHHEMYDGSGYPKGLKGDQIPIEGRMLAVVDTFDAITSDRPYRDRRPARVAIDELIKFKGTQFDPAIVDIFIEAYEEGLINPELTARDRSSLKMKMLIPS